MNVKTWIAGVGAAVLLGSGMVMTAAPASALLCGYPPVECPAGDTNPQEEQRVGATPAARAQAGMTLPSQEVADQTATTRPPTSPSRDAIGEAPKIEANRGDIVRVRTEATPRVTYRVLVKRNSGPYNNIGTVTAGPNGSVTVPAIQFDRRGTFTIALQGSDGSTLYVKIVV